MLLDLLKAEYYLDLGRSQTLLPQRSIFNLIHNETVTKLDFIVLKSDDYRMKSLREVS